jgi:catechol 2,3-dioxygenase-like lactoylglutathione lyase family enzyme
MASIDHITVKVNDLAASVGFYTGIMGFVDEGRDGPFAMMRVNPGFQLQLAEWGTEGADHYAFAVSRDEFDAIFERVKAAGLDFGPAYHNVGTNTGPGEESGAQGRAPTLYFFDPNKHLVEIRTYE